MRSTPLVLGTVLALAGSAIAGPTYGPPPKPGPPVRKSASLEFSAAALGEFAEATMADKAGDLEKAHDHYRRSLDDVKQPNALYNMADVERRMERYKDAIETYGKYLEAAPDAADRADVEQLIEKLKQTPPIITVDGDDARALVFLDGVLVGPSPQTIQIPPGWHAVDRVGLASFEHDAFEAKPLDMRHLEAPDRREKEAGNVVFTASSGLQMSGSWKDRNGDRMWRFPHRNDLPAGRYETVAFNEKYLCNSIVFDVPKGDGVLYVYIDAGAKPDRSACMPFTVKTKKLVFPP
ncbi:MAG: tetratricopeptide repeat protein [Polyangiales bacterium]